MKDKYGSEINVGDEVAFAFYDYFNCECFIQKAPIKSIDEENHLITLDLRGTDILDSLEFEYGCDGVILVKRKEEK
jgi:hypothetical protein